MVAKVRERFSVSKQETLNFNMERLNLRKLNELEVRKEYQIEITNRFAAWKNIKENIKISAAESLGL